MDPDARKQLQQQLQQLRGTVFVPHVVGLDVARAHELITGAGLVPVDWPDPAEPGSTVTGQIPEVRERAGIGTSVFLFFGRDGGAGDREPRRPLPTPLANRRMRPDARGD